MWLVLMGRHHCYQKDSFTFREKEKVIRQDSTHSHRLKQKAVGRCLSYTTSLPAELEKLLKNETHICDCHLTCQTISMSLR